MGALYYIQMPFASSLAIQAGKSNIAEGVEGGEGRAFNLVLHLQGPDGLAGDDL